MKFLAWFFAVIVFFSSFFVAFVFNLRQIVLTPENTKKMFVQTDFYNQAKSVIKRDLFEAETNNVELSSSAKNISDVMDQVDFQGKIETLISDFYQGLQSGGDFILTINLVDLKGILISQLPTNGDKQSGDEINNAIPDTWKIETAKAAGPITAISFLYRNAIIIVGVYVLFVILFFLFCILISHKYLKLFFWVFIIVGILLLLQRFAWAFINPNKIFASLISQGRSGMGILIGNFVKYFKDNSSPLLFWESLGLIIPSIAGLIVVSIIPEKMRNIPLSTKK